MSETASTYRTRRQAVAGITLIIVGLIASAIRFVNSDVTINGLYFVVLAAFAAGVTLIVKARNA